MMRRGLVIASVPVLSVVLATSALGAWKANGTGPAKSKALTVPQVTNVQAANGSGSSVITWDAIGAGGFSPGVTGYLVQRYTNASGTTGQTTVCANAATATCTDTVSAGTYFYGVTALYKPTGVNWSGPESTRDSATVAAAGPTMHIANYATSTQDSTNSWSPKVTITVRDGSNALVSGVTVTGLWSPTSASGNSCITNASGTCGLSVNNNTYAKASVPSATWTADATIGLVKPGVTWDKAADTAGSVTVTKP